MLNSSYDNIRLNLKFERDFALVLENIVGPSAVPHITGTLWNTMECCRGFEDMKDEISSSLKASLYFWVNFLLKCATLGLKIYVIY